MEICSRANQPQTLISPSPARTSVFARQAVRPIPMRIITVGKKRSKGVQLIAEEYMEKIKHYCVVEDVQIRSNPKNTNNIPVQIEGEDALIMQHIRPDDWVIMLDENGDDIGSKQMAQLVEDTGKRSNFWKKKVYLRNYLNSEGWNANIR